MALDANRLGTAIKNALEANGSVTIDDDAAAEAILQDFAGAIIDEITANGAVTVGSGISVQVDTSTGAGATSEAGSGTIA